MTHVSDTTAAVVLGQGITALGVVRSLGRAGIPSYLACPPGDFSGFSRWAKGLLVIPETDDPETLVRALDDLGFREGVLFPCSDMWAQAVSRLPDVSRDRYRSCMSPPEVLDILVDKVKFAAAVSRLGVPHPPTRIVLGDADLEQPGLERFFLKPNNSQRFSQHAGGKALTFNDAAEARAGLRMMNEAGVQAILQEYIPGPPTCHYFVDGFVDRGGTVRALFARRRSRMYPPDFGNSTLMVTVSLDEVAEAVSSVETLLSGIGFHGIFSAEFKCDPRDGTFKVLEVNGRPWWYNGFAARCGVDVSLLAYRDALGEEVATNTGYQVGVRCVLLHLDMRAFLHERKTNGLSVFGWLSSVIGAKPTVFAWSDPLPGLDLPVVVARRRWRRARAPRVPATGGNGS